jgi:choline dehydrogenase-like flavoprotein
MIETLGNARLDGRPFDVAIAGAGPAGISLAMRLARKRPDWRIALLEGGGEQPDPASAELHRGELGGISYPLDNSRLRFLGGASNHWGGWCRPLDETDFEPNPALDRPGWPIRHADLQPYWAEADKLCEIVHSGYEEDAINPERRARLLDLSASQWFRHRMYRFSPPTRFGTRYREELESLPNLHCLLDANLVQLEFRDDQVIAAQLRGLTGASSRLPVKRIILAMGGLENARFLLNLQQTPELQQWPWPKLVGQYFADHYGLGGGLLLSRADLGYAREEVAGEVGMPVIMYKDNVLREGASNLLIRFSPVAPDHWLDKDYALLQQRDNWTYQISVTIEPAPMADSRVGLAEQRDALGMRLLRLDWNVSDKDFQAATLACRRLARDVAQMDAGGRVRLIDMETRKPPESPLGPVFHHMGTTRMASDVEQGVVDADCRMFGSRNLYLAGSSVFASYGSANPTLNIVALALRLADHLAEQEDGSAA